MAVSGTYDFNLDIDQVIQEASEMIGGESTLGHEPESARRSINLMLKDWQNRGVLLWSTSTTAVTVVASTTSYNLDSSTINALEVVISRDNTDVKLIAVEAANIVEQGQAMIIITENAFINEPVNTNVPSVKIEPKRNSFFANTSASI